jgi:long-subunit acyl-CoA synthetase (AMP-forming)/acyl carrier protein
VNSIAELVKHTAARHGSKICVQVYDAQASQGITEITTFSQFHELALGASRLLTGTHGLRKGDTIAILADNSLLYLLLVFGAILAGIKILLVSTRCLPEHLEHFIKQTDCKLLLADLPHLKLARQCSSKLASLDADFYNKCRASVSQDQVTQPSANRASGADCALIMHTSGTTSMPRLVFLSHDNILANQRAVEQSIGAHWTVNDSSLLFLPLFHGYTLLSQFLRNLYIGATTTVLQQAEPPTPEVLLAAIRKSQPTFLCAVPWMLQLLYDLIQQEQRKGLDSALVTLQSLKFIITGGAPLDRNVGDSLIKQGIRLVTFYGLSEASGFVMHSSFTNPHWELLQPIPGLGITFVPVDANTGEHELQLLDSPAVARIPDFHENKVGNGNYHTSDLFLAQANGWAYLGRNDLVYNGPQGEKVNPLLSERAFQKLPQVHRIFVSGEGLLFNYAVVELTPELAGQAPVINELLKAIQEQINPVLDAPARIYPNDVLILEPGQTLPLTPKGTVNRKAALALLKQLIRKDAATVRKVHDRKAIRKSVMQQIRSYLGLASSLTLPGNKGLVELGFDSLMTLSLRNSLRQQLGLEASLDLMLGFPDIDTLVEHLDDLQKDMPSITFQPGTQVAPGQWSNILLEQVLFHTAHFIFPFPTFNVSMSLLAPGQLVAEKVRKALQELEHRHGILRSIYNQQGQYRIETHSFVEAALLGTDTLQGSHELEHNTQAQELIRHYLNSKFDLSSGPVYRYALHDIRDAQGKVRTLLYFGLHHVAGDFKGFNSLCGELMQKLASRSSRYDGTSDEYQVIVPSPEPTRLQVAQQCWLQLLTVMPALKEGLDPRAGSKQLFHFEDINLHRLANILRKHNISLYNGVYAVYALVASRYLPGQTPGSFQTATAITSRIASETEQMTGCFIHSPILHFALDHAQPLLHIMNKVQETTHGVFSRVLSDPAAWLQETLADPSNLVPFLHRNVFLYRSPEEIVTPPDNWNCYRNELFFDSCDVGMYFDFCSNRSSGLMEGYVLANLHYCDPDLIKPMLDEIQIVLRRILNEESLNLSPEQILQEDQSSIAKSAL